MDPVNCVLWKKETLLAEDLYDLFDEVHVFHQNVNSSKRLLRCKECGQLYLYEFTGSGTLPNESLQVMYFPVKQIGKVLEAAKSGLPRIEVLWPAGQEKPTAQWIK
jgi:hypothetical protein